MRDCAWIHPNNWLSLLLPAAYLFFYCSFGLIRLMCWHERGKRPLIIPKWVELCDVHIRCPQEKKRHANHLIWFSSVIIGDKCFLFVHLPILSSSTSPASLRFAWGDTPSERMERLSGECKKEWIDEQEREDDSASLWGGEYPQVVKFLVSFPRSEKPKKWNVCCDRAIDWQREMQTQGGLG